MSSGMMSGPLEAIEVLKDGRVNILTKNGIVNSALRSPDIVGDVVDVCDLETNICTPAPYVLCLSNICTPALFVLCPSKLSRELQMLTIIFLVKSVLQRPDVIRYAVDVRRLGSKICTPAPKAFSAS